ncbi:MAG: hypothetical protein ACFFD4_01745 [Candidatus Odinarchaeota archaeon]
MNMNAIIVYSLVLFLTAIMVLLYYIERVRSARTSDVTDHQQFKKKNNAGTRITDLQNQMLENQTAGFVTEIEATLAQIASWLHGETAIVSKKYSKEELLSLKKQLMEKKDQLTALFILLKDNRTGVLKREYTECAKLITVVETRITLVDKRIEELSNTWVIEHKKRITEVFKAIREYGKFIELNVLHERFSITWSSLKELCDFLEQVEKETSIWTFDGRYVELGVENYPQDGIEKLNCQICKKAITSKADHECCPECLSHFHYSHLAEWLKIKGKCPVCKKNMRVEGIRRR